MTKNAPRTITEIYAAWQACYEELGRLEAAALTARKGKDPLREERANARCEAIYREAVALAGVLSLTAPQSKAEALILMYFAAHSADSLVNGPTEEWRATETARVDAAIRGALSWFSANDEDAPVRSAGIYAESLIPVFLEA